MSTGYFLTKGQIDIYGCTAFGIHLSSRHGIAYELAEMLLFAEGLEKKGLTRYVESIFYDSGSCTCNFEFTHDVEKYSKIADQIELVAMEHISQFEIFDNICHGNTQRN
ncbi:hypothetical protein [Xenorhabdus szentirmaii]|nr:MULTISPECIES: hypothetical protein [Xenorhabdus]MBD2803486.1 hypothetical protein [Xenorhabdus sp. ZM]